MVGSRQAPRNKRDERACVPTAAMLSSPDVLSGNAAVFEASRSPFSIGVYAKDHTAAAGTAAARLKPFSLYYVSPVVAAEYEKKTGVPIERFVGSQSPHGVVCISFSADRFLVSCWPP